MGTLTLHKPSDGRLGLPIAPGRLPILGHMHQQIFWMVPFQHRIRQLGSDLVWIEPAPGIWSLECLDPEAISVLSSRELSNQHYSELAPLLLGRSVLTQDGRAHRSQRNAMNAPFSIRGLRVQGTSTIMQETVSAYVDRLARCTAFTTLTQTRTLALEIIFRILGIPYAELDAWRVQWERVLLAAFPIRWEWPGMPGWSARQGRAWVSTRIQDRIDAIRDDPSTTGLLAEMVRGWDSQEERPPDDSLLVDNIMLLVLAGHETTASTMAWMVCHLAQDPALWDRALDEACAGPGIPANPTELSCYPLIEAIFRECLRLYPPVPTVTRLLTQPQEVLGHALPAGVHLSFPILGWQRDPQRYPEPERFRPERWLGMDRKLDAIERIAFSSGPHFCLGYHVAWMEAVQFGVGLLRALSASGKRLVLQRGFPRARHLGLCHPQKRRTRVRVVPARPR